VHGDAGAKAALAERMYIDHYKIRDRYQVPVASLAVLAETDQGFRPQQYRAALWGCCLDFRFPTVKLLDYPQAAPWAELEAGDNVFALVAYEEQQQMPYVTTVEQAGIEKGVKQGEARTLLRLLERKFGPEAVQAHRERIEAAEIDQLEAWLERILSAETPETIFH